MRGHIVLVEVAKQHANLVVASIFVNSLQFSPTEDLRTINEDQKQITKNSKQLSTVIHFFMILGLAHCCKIKSKFFTSFHPRYNIT